MSKQCIVGREGKGREKGGEEREGKGKEWGLKNKRIERNKQMTMA
jgi:hypothetical protein